MENLCQLHARGGRRSVTRVAKAAAAAVHLSWPTNRSISPQPIGLTDDGDELLLGRITPAVTHSV